ncbi:MAG: DUF695 domain-containing protein [Candidatus Omnitrophica bacterium]|nr:DUF695 domain-containing protein [Candidatus Omnitrophota bacterium]
MAIFDDWNGYQREVKGEPCAIFLNLGLMRRLPIKDKTSLVNVQVRLNKMEQNEEFALMELDHALADMESRVRKHVEDQYDGVFAGRVTSNARRCFYFYVSDQHINSFRMDSVTPSFDTFEFQVDVQPDPEWKFYQDTLFPGQRDMQLMINHRMVDQLAEQGEQGDASRRVDHWIYFKEEGHRKSFLAAVGKFEFKVEEAPSARLDEYSFGAQIWRAELMTFESIDRVVLFLMDCAGQYQGQYDGWDS